VNADRQRLLDKYEFVDLARKVVGVGSVGTRAWVVLLTGADDGIRGSSVAGADEQQVGRAGARSPAE